MSFCLPDATSCHDVSVATDFAPLTPFCAHVSLGKKEGEREREREEKGKGQRDMRAWICKKGHSRLTSRLSAIQSCLPATLFVLPAISVVILRESPSRPFLSLRCCVCQRVASCSPETHHKCISFHLLLPISFSVVCLRILSIVRSTLFLYSFFLSLSLLPSLSATAFLFPLILTTRASLHSTASFLPHVCLLHLVARIRGFTGQMHDCN